MLAYVGPPVPLERLILEPDHSLYTQSYAPREMSSGVVNADGFGFSWYDSARGEEAFCYKSILPIWGDGNLRGLARYVTSGHVLANVRSATPGQGVDHANTHPFVSGPFSGMHNGFVDNFHETLYRRLRESLSDESFRLLRGSTDSEHIFGAFLDGARDGTDLAAALEAALDRAAGLAPDTRMSLAFVVSDGRTMAISRASRHMPAPSLYMAWGHRTFADGVLIASEPFDEDPAWRMLPAQTVLSVSPGLEVISRPWAGA